MKCRTVQKYIPDYISGELDEAKTSAVKEHIKDCTECSEIYAFFNSYLKESKTIKAVKAPKDFESRLFRRINARPEKTTLLNRLKMPFPFKIPVEAIGLAAIAVVVFFFWKPYEPAKKTFTEFDKNISEGTRTVEKSAPADHVSRGQSVPDKPQIQSPKAAKKLLSKDNTRDKEIILPPEKNISSYSEKDMRKKSLTAADDIEQAEEEAVALPASAPEVIVFNLILKSTAQLKEERTSDKSPTEPVREAEKKRLLARQSAPAGRATEAPKSSAGPVISNNADDVIDVVKKTGGTVIETVKHNSGVTVYFLVDIPSSKYDLFLEEISRLGALTKAFDHAPAPRKKKVRIRINLQ